MLKLKATAGGIDIDDGEYEATLLSIEKRQPTPNSPNDKEWLLWTFTVYTGETDLEMAQGTSINFTPRANARKWAQNLEGREFPAGEDFDLETLPPRDCRIVVERDEKGFARIINVMAQRRRPAPKRPTSHDGVEV